MFGWVPPFDWRRGQAGAGAGGVVGVSSSLETLSTGVVGMTVGVVVGACCRRDRQREARPCRAELPEGSEAAARRCRSDEAGQQRPWQAWWSSSGPRSRSRGTPVHAGRGASPVLVVPVVGGCGAWSAGRGGAGRGGPVVGVPVVGVAVVACGGGRGRRGGGGRGAMWSWCRRGRRRWRASTLPAGAVPVGPVGWPRGVGGRARSGSWRLAVRSPVLAGCGVRSRRASGRRRGGGAPGPERAAGAGGRGGGGAGAGAGGETLGSPPARAARACDGPGRRRQAGLQARLADVAGVRAVARSRSAYAEDGAAKRDDEPDRAGSLAALKIGVLFRDRSMPGLRLPGSRLVTMLSATQLAVLISTNVRADLRASDEIFLPASEP